MERVVRCVIGVAGMLACLGCGERDRRQETQSQPVRDALEQGIETAKDKAQALKEHLPEAREHVREAMQDAKAGAERLKEQLPPAEEVKADLREAGQHAAEKLRAAGQTIEREALDARQKIRESVRDERR